MRRKERRSMKRRILGVFLTLLLLIPLAAAAEEEYWICPECLRGGNRQNFCTNCGTAKPAPAGWTCACGTVNTGNFCTNCGAKNPALGN